LFGFIIFRYHLIVILIVILTYHNIVIYFLFFFCLFSIFCIKLFFGKIIIFL
ncbi:hypothetical protein H8356DRAFT_1618903, partial [Neocallimastix lanati (nom. inval.)]